MIWTWKDVKTLRALLDSRPQSNHDDWCSWADKYWAKHPQVSARELLMAYANNQPEMMSSPAESIALAVGLPSRSRLYKLLLAIEEDYWGKPSYWAIETLREILLVMLTIPDWLEE